MPIDIGGVQLTKIHRVETLENAHFVYHNVPGLQGSLSQDMGRASVRLLIEGIFYGQNAKTDLEGLRATYTARQPVDFLADIVGQSYVGQVIIDRFEVVEAAGFPEQFSYSMIVAEYVPPPQAATTGLDSLDMDISLDAGMLLDLASLDSLPDVSNPIEPLNDAMGPVQDAVNGLQGSLEGLTKLFGD